MWLLFRSFERKTTNIVELKNTPESFEKYIKWTINYYFFSDFFFLQLRIKFTDIIDLPQFWSFKFDRILDNCFFTNIFEFFNSVHSFLSNNMSKSFKNSTYKVITSRLQTCLLYPHDVIQVIKEIILYLYSLVYALSR